MQTADLELLGLQTGATRSDIRSAYRQLARTLHPDVNGSADAAQAFAEVHAAYERLLASDSPQAADPQPAPHAADRRSQPQAAQRSMDPAVVLQMCRNAVAQLQAKAAAGEHGPAYAAAADLLQEGVNSHAEHAPPNRQPAVLFLVQRFLADSHEWRTTNDESLRFHLAESTLGIVGLRRVDPLTGHGASLPKKENAAVAIMSAMTQALAEQGLVSVAELGGGEVSLANELVTEAFGQLEAGPQPG